jgi:hypothetical protein
MKAFSLYLKFKIRYRNGMIYNYNPETISKEFKISTYQARKCLGDLKKLELVRVSGKTVLLNSFKHIKSGNKVRKEVNIHMTDSMSVVVTKLQFALLRYNLIDKQLYIKKTLTNFDDIAHSKGENIKAKRAYRKLVKLGYSYSENVNVKICAGYRKMAKIMGISTSSVRTVLWKLIKWKYIKGIKYLIEKMFNIDYGTFISTRKYIDGFSFYKAGCVYRHNGTLIDM